MKELSIEDKAKRYDELKVKAQELTEDGYIDKLALLDLFPELKESDEERIREWLICTLKSLNNSPVQIDGAYEMMLPAIAWLEKQGEKGINGNEREIPFSEQKPIQRFSIGDYVKNTNYNGEPIYEIVYMDKECYICEYRGKENIGDRAVMHFAFDNPYLRLVQKPADKTEPKFKVGDKIVSAFNTPYYITKVCDRYYLTDVGRIIMFNAQDNFELAEQNPAWSEEDETTINNLVWAISNDCIRPQDREDYCDWLKSIKDRVQPQPQQEWSEEDEGMLYGVIETEQYMLDVVDGIKKFDVGNCDIRKACSEELNWLKSLRPLKQWKPSDEQMNALNDVISSRDIK